MNPTSTREQMRAYPSIPEQRQKRGIALSVDPALYQAAEYAHGIDDPERKWKALDALLAAMGFGLLKRRALRPKADFGDTIDARNRNLNGALRTALDRLVPRA